ncbi:MAG: PIG-L family deacetylase [Acidobacteriota bacterium]|nr:PIG-L family deacetylase [Acidobacteriota bacterium]
MNPRRSAWLVAPLLSTAFLHAQPATTADIELGLRKVNELGTVLMIAAHPDDERTNVLAYFARGRNMRTAYLSVTRGEGGQNLIGAEQGATLGEIRTEELLAARKIDGAEQFFSRAIDFGFSKTAAESIEKWGHENVLSDLVWVIRRYRPDVIILGFSGTPADGHGQHQASAILGKEAFEAAGDRTKFPEQLKYVQPWRANKLVYAGRFGAPGRGGRGADTPPPPPPIAPAFPFSTVGFNPYLGYTYDELASISRSQHRSQGFGNIGNGPPGGRGGAGGRGGNGRGGNGRGGAGRGGQGAAPQVAEAAPAPGRDVFEGIDHSWKRLPGGAAVDALLGQAIREFDPAHPENTIPLLVKARPPIAAMDDPLAKIKLGELDELIGKCAGLWVEAVASAAEVTPGSKVHVTVNVYPRLPVKVTVQSAQAEGVWTAPAVTEFEARQGGGETAGFDLEIPKDQAYSQQYWLEKAPIGERYAVSDERLAGLPESPVEEMRFRMTVAGTPVELVRRIENRSTERAEPERVRPITVVPPVSVNLTSGVAIFPSANARKLSAVVRAEVANAAGELRARAPEGWKVEPASLPFRMSAAGEERDLSFTVTPPAGDSTAGLELTALVGGREIGVGMTAISYPHIPIEAMFPRAEVKLVRADIHVDAHRVGYIMGAGDEVPDALRQMGVEVTMLNESDLAKGDLSRFDAIVAGVRAYNVRADLRANQARLMDYVSRGGTYVAQYMSAGAQNIGPYKINIPAGNGYRVTVEDAPMRFTHPDSRLLQAPNHIAQKDFEGWVQERGLLFPTEWDPKYETVFSSNDPGEKALEGGELWTHYGKGVYIFSSYVWFRELPAGVPGAYRLFANMLSAK